MELINDKYFFPAQTYTLSSQHLTNSQLSATLMSLSLIRAMPHDPMFQSMDPDSLDCSIELRDSKKIEFLIPIQF
jgi:hypothetical protein